MSRCRCLRGGHLDVIQGWAAHAMKIAKLYHSKPKDVPQVVFETFFLKFVHTTMTGPTGCKLGKLLLAFDLKPQGLGFVIDISLADISSLSL